MSAENLTNQPDNSPANEDDVPRLVRVCVSCGSRPEYSNILESDWIVCPNGCCKIFVRGGAPPEVLELEWNKANHIALKSEVTETPFDEYFDANDQADTSP